MGQTRRLELGSRELRVLQEIVEDRCAPPPLLQQAVALLRWGLPGADQKGVAKEFGIPAWQLAYAGRQLVQHGRIPKARWGHGGGAGYLAGREPRTVAMALLLRNAMVTLRERQDRLTAAAEAAARAAAGTLGGAGLAEPLRKRGQRYAKSYKRKILDDYNALPRGPLRARLLKDNDLTYAHLRYWREQGKSG